MFPGTLKQTELHADGEIILKEPWTRDQLYKKNDTKREDK